MLACIQGSDCAAALIRHLPSNRSPFLAGWSVRNRQPDGRACAVSGIWMAVAIRAALLPCSRTSQGLAQGIPLTGRNILCSSSRRPFLSAAKARHMLRISSVQFERCSFGPFLEAAPGIPFRAGFRTLRRSNGPARIVRKRASSSVALRRRRDGGALRVASLRRRTSRDLSHWESG